ncbi:DUF4738 domain-containing protein [Changchengzhania lutea]|uniref:DUF4738 domain-containing protein n=1 Tax=Changchengzhania lutea TaxID=2049305 RepID=UPI00115E1B83|nr:DUF4738 domain-containing protein [Changchengzhania lutea]
MKNLIIIIFLIYTFSIMNCDGRYRSQKSHQQVLVDNKLFDSFSKQVQYIPEGYSEIVTDTILNNGYQIKMNYHSIETDYVLEENQTLNQIETAHHYKDFEAHLMVLKDDHLLINTLIDKSDFNKFENPSFWKKAIMQFLWVDYARSENNTLYLNTSFCTPDNQVCKDFVIKINEIGNLEIDAINLDEHIL